MALTAYTLSDTAHDAAGAVLPGAKVRIQLTDTKGRPAADFFVGSGSQQPVVVERTADDSGAWSADLPSNLDGNQDLRYRVTITHPTTGAGLTDELIQMPRAASTLAELVDATSVTPDPETAAALERAFAGRYAAEDEDVEVVDTDGNGTGNFSALHQAAKAEGHKDTAATKAGEASDSADAAAASEINAANSETAAAGSATAAANSETAADADRVDAQAAAAAAQTAEAGANAIADSDITSALKRLPLPNVVALDVYETAKDSDGGAWVDRATHQSWYSEARPSGAWLGWDVNDLATAAADGNASVGAYYWNVASNSLRELTALDPAADKEIVRGSKATFPRTGGILGQQGNADDKLVVVDGDDPALPPWMVFDADATASDLALELGVSHVAARNGLIVWTSGQSLRWGIIDFIQDGGGRRNNSTRYVYRGLISDRNREVGFFNVGGDGLADDTVNTVALYVAPLAPIDPQTGLPRPVIECATDGGVSVIREDGTVVDSSSTAAINRVAFLDDGTLLYTLASGQIAAVPAAAWRAGSFSPSYTLDFGLGDLDGVVALGSNLAAHDEGDDGVSVTRFAGHESDVTTALLASDYALPPYPLSSIALALSSTETADLVGSGELVPATAPTDTQDATVAAGTTYDYDLTMTATPSYVSWDTGQLNPAGWYRVVLNTAPISGSTEYVQIGAAAFGNEGLSQPFNGDFIDEVYLSESWRYVTLFRGDGDLTPDWGVDIPSIQRIEPDRSGNDVGPIAYGTLSRAIPETGAVLTTLAGWAAANYLEHATDHLAPGTADFMVTIAARGGAAGDCIFEYGQYSAGYSGGGIRLSYGGSSGYELVVTDDGFATTDTVSDTSAAAGASDPLDIISVGRLNGSWVMFRNGRFVGSTAVTNAATSLSGGVMRYGLRLDDSNAWAGEIWSVVLADNASTTLQAIEERHAVMRAWTTGDPTLLSDTVDALSYDPDVAILDVAGPAGTTRMHVPSMVRDTTLTSSDSELTSDDHNAVAGGGGILALASANEVRFSLPALALRDRLLRQSVIPARGTAVQGAATTDATPTVVAAVHLAEGEVRTFEAIVRAEEAGDPGSSNESAQYRVTFAARRPIDGNIELLGTPTVTVDHEVTASQDLTVAADTTNQLIELTGTGVASTDLVWTTEIRAVGDLLGRAA